MIFTKTKIFTKCKQVKIRNLIYLLFFKNYLVSEEYLKTVKVPLPFPPLHLALNHDESILCVCYCSTSSFVFAFYNLELLYTSNVRENTLHLIYIYICNHGNSSTVISLVISIIFMICYSG